MIISADSDLKSWSWPTALTLITLLALALRWYYVAVTIVPHPIRGDAVQYFSYAWNLVHHGVFAKAPPSSAIVVADSYRDPGYPLFLALMLGCMGQTESWYEAVLLCQALMGALTVGIATHLGRHWLPPAWATLAGLLMALWPHSITINSFLLSETLFGFLCALALLLSARAFRRKSIATAAISGLFFGAAALTNAVLLPFGVILGAAFVWRRLAPRSICCALILGAVLPPAVWALRNTQISTPAVGMSSKDRAMENFVIGSAPSYQPLWRQEQLGATDSQRTAARAVLDSFDREYGVLRNDHLKGASLITSRLREKPLHYLYWYFFQKPFLFWGWDIQIGVGDIYVYPSDNSPFTDKRGWIALEAICHSINRLLLLLALGSLPLAFSKKLWPKSFQMFNGRPAFIAVTGMACFVTVIYCALQAEPRYSIPFRALEFLLAVTTAATLFTQWKEYHQNLRRSARETNEPF